MTRHYDNPARLQRLLLAKPVADEGLPLTGWEAALAISIVFASFFSACLIVNFLSQL